MAEGVGIEPTQQTPDSIATPDVVESLTPVSYSISYCDCSQRPFGGLHDAAQHGMSPEHCQGRRERYESGERPLAPSATSAPREGVTGHRFSLRDLRRRCIDCVGSTQKATRCDHTDCALWDYHNGHRPKGYKATHTPMKALRAYCLWCCGDSPKEVRLCPCASCPLWPWRMGRATGEARPDGGGAIAPSTASET